MTDDLPDDAPRAECDCTGCHRRARFKLIRLRDGEEMWRCATCMAL